MELAVADELDPGGGTGAEEGEETAKHEGEKKSFYRGKSFSRKDFWGL